MTGKKVNPKVSEVSEEIKKEIEEATTFIAEKEKEKPDNTKDPRLLLLHKLSWIRNQVGYLQKEKKGYQYNYVASSQVLNALSGHINSCNLLLVPKIINSEVKEYRRKNKHGDEIIEYLTELEMVYTWIECETGYELSFDFYAQGIDTGEKGVGKALTYGEKYFLLKFFNIATDKDDPDYVANQKPKVEPAPAPPTFTPVKDLVTAPTPIATTKPLIHQDPTVATPTPDKMYEDGLSMYQRIDTIEKEQKALEWLANNRPMFRDEDYMDLISKFAGASRKVVK